MPRIRGIAPKLPTAETVVATFYDTPAAVEPIVGPATATIPAGPASRFVVRVDDDHMAPTLPLGCRVVCDPDDYDIAGIRPGRPYWVRLTDRTTVIRRVSIDGPDLRFTGDNPSHRGFSRPATDVTAAALVVQMILDVQ